MMFAQLLEANRSFRGFLQEPRMDREALEALVALTRLCPSSGNLQPLKYKILWDSEVIARILPLVRWGGAMREPKLPREGMAPTAYIVILHDLAEAPNPQAFARDVGIAAHTILLGATERGFGGCMLGSFRAAETARLLELPENLVPALIIAIGKPAEDIRLEDAPPGFVNHDNCYYRDSKDVHHVWKRPIEEIIVP